MSKSFLERFLQKVAFLSVTTSILLVVCPLGVEAAKPPPEPLSCSISPADGSTVAGVPVTFAGNTQGGRNVRIFSWDFSDGAGVPAASVENTVAVTYSTVGTFNVLLAVEDKDAATASCSTTVTVTDPPPPSAGETLYRAKCIMCHGEFGAGGYAHRSVAGPRPTASEMR